MGHFVNFNLPYRDTSGKTVSPQAQARAIISKAQDMVKEGSRGVAITYSANYGQTREIERVYFGGGWNTQTNGINQATVMSTMESLLGSDHHELQGMLRIVPITTMNAYDDPVSGWSDDVLLGIVTTDLDRIKSYLDGGWDVLGWQNQDSVHDAHHPYAVGGGVASLPQAVSDLIQRRLTGFASDFAPPG